RLGTVAQSLVDGLGQHVRARPEVLPDLFTCRALKTLLTLAVALSGGPWLGGCGLSLERGLRARLGRPRGQRREPQHLGCVVRVETLGGLDPEQPRQHRSQWACVGGFLRLVQLLLTQNLDVAL